MRVARFSFAMLIVLLAAGAAARAQQERVRTREGRGPGRPEAVRPTRTPATPALRPPAAPADAGTRGRPAERGSYSGGSNGYPGSNPYNRTYRYCRDRLSDYYRYSWWRASGRYQADAAAFLSRLWLRYGLGPDDPLYRYAQGDTVLSPDVVEVALRQPSAWAMALLYKTRYLEAVLDQYESGKIPYPTFEERVNRVTREIRELADRIEDDSNLKYLDPGRDIKVQSRDTVRTVPELRTLVVELRSNVIEILSGLASFQGGDPRVVSVSELSKPSLQSLSKRVEKLAKTIENSADKLS